jgi:hypothetical protein
VELLFSRGKTCGDSIGPRVLRVEVACGEDGDSPPAAAETSPCAYTVRLASRAGCPTQCRASEGLSVCGGAERGRCVRAAGGGARCECAAGVSGAFCGEGAPLLPPPPPPLPPRLALPQPLRLLPPPLGEPVAPPLAPLRAAGAPTPPGGSGAVAAAAAVGAAAGALLRRGGRSRALQCALLVALVLLLGLFAAAGAPAAAELAPALAPVLARAPLGAAALNGGPCSHAPGLHFAVYQQEPHHTDLFGFLLDFAALCGHNFTLFVGHPDAPVSVVPVWQRLYGPLRVLHTSAFLEHQGRFDAVFFTTPDSPGNHGPDKKWQLSNQGRCVYISHKSNKGFTKMHQMVRLYSSPLSGYPYVITAFSGGAIVPAAERERVVVYVGSIYDGENARLADISAFAAALAPAGFSLRIYCNTIEGDTTAFFAATPNAEWVRGAPTEELYGAVARAAFFLILPSAGSAYLRDRGTNSIALAFSMATPIITHLAFAGLYDLGRERTGTLAVAVLPELTAALAEMSPRAYGQLVHAAAEHRAQLLLHNVRSLEYALDALPELSSRRGQLPLPRGIALRIPYEWDQRR